MRESHPAPARAPAVKAARSPGRCLLGVALALVAAAGGGCGGGTPAAVEAGTPVVVISIDTLRSDRLPAYGYRDVDTPAIDALRTDAILFTAAYSHTPLTFPSHVSLLTGLTPDRHGVRDNLGYVFTEAAGGTLAGALRGAGYATGAAVSAVVLRRETGLAADFDFYDDDIDFRPGSAGAIASRRGDVTLAAARPWLAAVAGRPFFFLFHIYEPHTPYEAPEELMERYPSPYDAEVAAADAVIGELIRELERLGVYERALVILTSDHGEGLGDHGEPEHGILLYREAIAVPLMIKLPHAARGGETVGRPVGLVDVYPTVAGLLGLEPPAGVSGTSLLFDGPEGGSVYAETFYPRLHFGWSELASIVGPRYHYIHGPDPELYDLIADPGERRNLIAEERRVAVEMRRRLDGYDRELQPPGEVDAETRQKLASLGYLGGTVAAGDGPLPDPKERLPTLESLWRAQELQRLERHEEAAAASRRSVAENPQMVDGWEVLGSSLENLGRFDEALAAYQEALEISGPTADLVVAMARVRLELGEVDEAVAGLRYADEKGVSNLAALRQAALQLAELGRLEEAREILARHEDPHRPDSLVALGRVLSELGRDEEARARLERALELDPESARAEEYLGLVHLRRGDPAAAEAHSRRAVELDPGRADAWNNLGAALYFEGRPAEAIAAWREAVERDPGQYETLFNLGVKAPELGDLELARWALRRFIDTAPRDRYREDIASAEALLRRLGE